MMIPDSTVESRKRSNCGLMILLKINFDITFAATLSFQCSFDQQFLDLAFTSFMLHMHIF